MRWAKRLTRNYGSRAEREGVMKIIRAVAVVALVCTSLLLAVPAQADPPLGTNMNAGEFIFHCTRGGETQTFETTSINQSAAIALQLQDGTGVIMYTHVEVNGQVVYDRPGQASRTDLWTCTIEGVPGVVAQMFVTPRG
jgi:hypothetical protein